MGIRGGAKDRQRCMHAAYAYPCDSFSSLVDLYVSQANVCMGYMECMCISHTYADACTEGTEIFPRGSPGLNHFSHPPPATPLSSSSSWTSLARLLLP